MIDEKTRKRYFKNLLKELDIEFDSGLSSVELKELYQKVTGYKKPEKPKKKRRSKWRFFPDEVVESKALMDMIKSGKLLRVIKYDDSDDIILHFSNGKKMTIKEWEGRYNRSAQYFPGRRR